MPCAFAVRRLSGAVSMPFRICAMPWMDTSRQDLVQHPVADRDTRGLEGQRDDRRVGKVEPAVCHRRAGPVIRVLPNESFLAVTR